MGCVHGVSEVGEQLWVDAPHTPHTQSRNFFMISGGWGGALDHPNVRGTINGGTRKRDGLGLARSLKGSLRFPGEERAWAQQLNQAVRAREPPPTKHTHMISAGRCSNTLFHHTVSQKQYRQGGWIHTPPIQRECRARDSKHIDKREAGAPSNLRHATRPTCLQ